MKCQILFSKENMKNIINLSYEFAQRVVKVKVHSPVQVIHLNKLKQFFISYFKLIFIFTSQLTIVNK